MSLWDSFTSAIGTAWDTATDWFSLEDVATSVSDADIYSDFTGGLLQQAGESGAASFITDDFGEIAYGSFFDQVSDYATSASDYVTSGISDFFSAENIKKGAKAIAGQIAENRLSATKRGANAQDQARRTASNVLGSGRGVGVSGTAPGQQFTPGSVQSLIARTNAGKIAFQPGTIDTTQNLVNIISEAFTETGATSPTGAGKISPSASKIEKVGTSYFS